jgi:hypothetical protein
MIYKYKYNIYLRYLRYRISKIKSSNDIIKILRNIDFFFYKIYLWNSIDISTDMLSTIITDCINKYPLSIKEMQIFSLLQQYYENSKGLEEYATFLFWICIIQSVNENKNKEQLYLS